mmetsp:Transcript_32657/g.64908  ORF Transcript_32657/g.64908 Transcript_32657/m.64908 type:complete len:88 (-) Transcript_32657:8-271(-)
MARCFDWAVGEGHKLIFFFFRHLGKRTMTVVFTNWNFVVVYGCIMYCITMLQENQIITTLGNDYSEMPSQDGFVERCEKATPAKRRK